MAFVVGYRYCFLFDNIEELIPYIKALSEREKDIDFDNVSIELKFCYLKKESSGK